MQPFQLVPFSPPGAGLTLGGGVARVPAGLRADFQLAGDLSDVVLPAPASSPGRRDGLWRRSCLELFLARAGAPAYVEVNAAPSGDWNAYAFSGYREGMTPLGGAGVDLAIVRVAPRSIEIGLSLSLGEALPDEIELGVSAVIEHGGGERSYWALAHLGERPDFHLRASFLLRL